MNLLKSIGNESIQQFPYVVVANTVETATLRRGNNQVKIPNAGYQIGQTVLFDGNTVLNQPAETLIINI